MGHSPHCEIQSKAQSQNPALIGAPTRADLQPRRNAETPAARGEEKERKMTPYAPRNSILKDHPHAAQQRLTLCN